jgi:hypothetical protein
MSELRPADDFGISSVWRMSVGDLVTEQAPDPVNRSHSETLICARITEVRSDRQTNLDGHSLNRYPQPMIKL